MQENSADPHADPLTYSADSEVCCNDAWEEAYARFETPEEEIRKFQRRLSRAGAAEWPRESEILEIFCGRGNGLHALQSLGLTRLEGADLSASLLAQYQGPARLHVCDCRQMPFEDRSKDVVIVQGGLHHLPTLPEDLERTISEARRVLRDGGLFFVVEPWLTPFLSFVHRVSEIRWVRRLVPKIDAFAVMTENERETYEQWLSQPEAVKALLEKHFSVERCSTAWGKILFLGRKGP